MKKEVTRITSFTVVVIIVFSVLIARLFYVQLIKGDYFQSLAEEKGEKEIIDPAPRGEITDRKGQKLATSIQGYNITFSNYNKKGKEKSDVVNKRINTALLETIRILAKNGNTDKLNLASLPIVLEGDNYVYNFTATSDKLRAKQESNFKKSFGIDKVEAKIKKDTGKAVSLNINEVVVELQKKYGLIDENTKKSLYVLTKEENMQLLALRAAISNVAYSQYKTVYIAKNVPQSTALAIISRSSDLPGITYEIAPIRYYPNHEVGSAFLGYLGKIDESSAEEYKSLGYDINRELIGKLGLEKALENNKDLGINLRGEPGVRYVNVDKYGQITKETAKLDPIPGDTVKTTIDFDLQKVAEESLDKTMQDIRGKAKGGNSTRGAAIVTDVKTGEILALASRGGYDPNVFAETGSISDPEIYKKYFVPEKNEGDKYDKLLAPMYNYVTKGAAPPGSIFKPFVGVAGLEEGIITPSSPIVCTGHYNHIKSDKYNCWIYNGGRKGSHGPLNIAGALEVSCNIFFFDVARQLGYEKFTDWAAKFGLASDPKTGEKPKSGIEIEESPGTVGSDSKIKASSLAVYLNQVVSQISKIENGGYTITKGTEEYRALEDMFNTGEYDKTKLEAIGIVNKKAQRTISSKINEFIRDSGGIGQLLNLAIGQGSTQLTPLQMIGALNTLLNDGKRYSTHLVKEVLNPDETVKREIKPEVLEEVKISPESKAAILKGMSKVTKGEHGTAMSTFAGFNMETGGKTGSASVSKAQEENGRKAYGWFMGFAPLENPEISVIVVIYDANSGSYAAPVARDIYDEYFKERLGLDKKEDNTENAPMNQSEANYSGSANGNEAGQNSNNSPEGGSQNNNNNR